MAWQRFGAILLLATLAACAESPKPDAPIAVAKSDTAAYLVAAEATRNDGRFSEAMEIYRKILLADRNSIPAQYGMAECLLGLGRAQDAKPIFDTLQNNAEFHAMALQGLGIAELALDHREAAANALQEAIQADPKLWRAYNGLAMLADQKLQPVEAAKLYGMALAINPNSAMLLNNLGYSRLLAGKPDEAIANFNKALGLDPHSDTIQNNLRIAIALKGNYDEATRGVSRDKQAVVLNNVGFIAMRRGDLVTAEGLLWRAMEADPHYDATAAKNLDQLNAMKGATK